MVVALTKDRQMDTGGVMGFCTWETLSSQLLTPIEIAAGKRVVEFIAHEHGMQFVIE
jgi:hypothetical protein